MWHRGGGGGQPNDSRGGRDDGRSVEPLLKPGSAGVCPIDGFRLVQETSRSCCNKRRRQLSKQKKVGEQIQVKRVESKYQLKGEFSTVKRWNSSTQP